MEICKGLGYNSNVESVWQPGFVKRRLVAGVCHICPKGSEHSIINTGDDDLVLITVVVER